MFPQIHLTKTSQIKKAIGLLSLLLSTWATVIGLALCVLALVNYADNVERHTHNDVLFTMMYALLAILIGLLTGKQGRALLKQVYAQDSHRQNSHLRE